MASRDLNDPQHALRFLDVDEEPLAILPSLQDYQNIPPASLNEAVIPLQTIVFDVKQMVQTIKANYGKPEDGLSRDQSNSIRLYSLEWQPKDKSLFYILNQALRSENRQLLRPWFLFLRLILTALYRLPSTSLIVYRGANMDLANKYPVGATIVWWGFASCMKKSNLLEKKLFLNKTGKRTLFVISCFSGKDIHRHSVYESEDEVLLPPGCQFNVVNCENKGKGLHIVELQEIQSPYDFLNAFSLPTNASTTSSVRNVQFQTISMVSLSKKTIPAALPNPHVEERLAYFFKQRSKVDLQKMALTDSDMDIVVSEVIVKRQCMELDLSDNRITHAGMLRLAHALRKNKVRATVSFDLISNQLNVQHYFLEN